MGSKIQSSGSEDKSERKCFLVFRVTENKENDIKRVLGDGFRQEYWGNYKIDAQQISVPFSSKTEAESYWEEHRDKLVCACDHTLLALTPQDAQQGPWEIRFLYEDLLFPELMEESYIELYKSAHRSEASEMRTINAPGESPMVIMDEYMRQFNKAIIKRMKQERRDASTRKGNSEGQEGKD